MFVCLFTQASTVRVAKPKKIKTLKRSTKAEDVDAQLKQEGGREHAQTPTKTPEAKKARSRKVEGGYRKMENRY